MNDEAREVKKKECIVLKTREYFEVFIGNEYLLTFNCRWNIPFFIGFIILERVFSDLVKINRNVRDGNLLLLSLMDGYQERAV